jgi:ribosomal protein S18 acetylase RimI-like enzyme
MSLRILQRLFNVAPSPNWDYIIDNQGEKYWIHWGTHHGLGPKLWVRYKGNWVATVESAWKKDGGIDLADIIIFERYSYLRQRGLGKKMLQCFIERAKEEGASYIWGFIKAHNGSDEEYLAEWYLRQGFQVKGSLIYLELKAHK